MTAVELLDALRRRGIVFKAEGDTLCYRAPAGVLADVDRAALVRHKAAVLELLRGEATYADRLRAVYGRLSPADWARLEAEISEGDHLATLVLAGVAGSGEVPRAGSGATAPGACP